MISACHLLDLVSKRLWGEISTSTGEAAIHITDDGCQLIE